ncbi:MAG: starch-binding protein [Eubacteriales bacterium]|nr:starch-binding protein [Eubacteriales bacterium]
MMKKIICALLVLISILSVTASAVSAAETEIAPTGSGTTIYFEVPSNWNNFKKVYCHIWAYGSPTPLANWQSKKETCTLEEDGRYSYDISKVGGLESGVYYGIVFSNDLSVQTYDTLMTSACYGDTMYCNGTFYEHPLDSNKTGQAAFWKNQDPAKYGPLMQITSLGNLIGTCLPPDITAEKLFGKFLTETLDNARQYSGKTDQDIIDDMAQGLGLSQDSIEKLINQAGVSVQWEKAQSDAPLEDKPLIPASTGAVSTGQNTCLLTAGILLMAFSLAALIIAGRKRAAQ